MVVRRIKKLSLAIIGLAAIFLALSSACNDGSGFTGPSKGLPGQAPSSSSPSPSVSQGDSITERFKTSMVESQVDMLWVIDNSGSMSEEFSSVNKNFLSFYNSLASKVGINVAVMSTACTGESSRFCIETSRFDQSKIKIISKEISSTNALAFVSAASCAATNTQLQSATSGQICGVPYNAKPGLEDPRGVAGASGILTSFFRPDAHKVIVVVTDDKARGFLADNFIAAMSKGGISDFTFFGFISLGGGGSSGCQGTRGEDYVTLAERTKGAIFDICDADWSANFSKLSDGVKRMASRRFTLKTAPQTVLDVKVDGRSLSKTAYKLLGNAVEITDESILTGADQSVEVTYR